MWASFLVACAASNPVVHADSDAFATVPTVEPEIPSRPTIEVARTAYPGCKTALEQSRIALKTRYDAAAHGDARTQIVAEARRVLLDGITRELLPAW